MPTYFISDLHLHEGEPKITANFLRFMSAMAPQAKALYVLGDLFEAWIGDDIKSELNTQVIQAFRHLHEKGVPVYFMHGNRDFLLGRRFASAAKLTLLPDPSKIDLYGKEVLLMHGDLLCTDDKDYLRFRRFVHRPWVKFLFLLLPKFIRNRFAQKLRKKSETYGKQANPIIQDVNQKAVEDIMTEYKVDLLIHGHTHRPAIHELTVHARPAKRVVLAAWHNGGEILRYDERHEISIIDL